MTAAKPDGKPKLNKVHKQYRRLLKRPKLVTAEIEAMRKHMILLARTICEHVWGKKFY